MTIGIPKSEYAYYFLGWILLLKILIELVVSFASILSASGIFFTSPFFSFNPNEESAPCP